MCLKFCIRFILYQTTLQLGMKNSSHPSTASRLLFMTCSLFRYYDPPLQYCSRNSTPIQFRISSNMCIRGSCGKFGRCYQFFSGGNMFSTCTCFAGKKNFQGQHQHPEKMLLSKLQSHITVFEIHSKSLIL